MNFDEYAKYYDLLNDDKNYEMEANYFMQLAGADKGATVLEIGTGTGGHAEYFSKIFDLTCIEKSGRMAEQAQKKMNAKVVSMDALDYSYEGAKYDACFCLFHVLNYFTENSDLVSLITKLASSLKIGGRLIVDFWHTPSVYSIGPSSREKKREHNNCTIKRVSNSSLNVTKNIVEVSFELEITNNINGTILGHHSEVHRMRPFTIVELELIFSQVGLKVIDTYNNHTLESPTIDSWDVCVVAERLD